MKDVSRSKKADSKKEAPKEKKETVTLEAVRTVTPISDKVDQIKVNGQEEIELRSLSGGASSAKSDISDIQLQILSLEQERTQRVIALEQAVKAYQEKVRAIAVSHGVDMADPNQRWSFDVDNLIYTRVTT